jgi:hypothetical protein
MIRFPWQFALLAFAGLLARPGFAALGGDEASVEADAAKMAGSRQVTNAPRYAVHEIRTPYGLVVREYVSASGTVFAIVWRGRRHPDMKLLLGEAFERYGWAARLARHRPVVVDEPDLVIRSGGHMRAFFGQAFLPLLVPQGVRIEELR